MTSDLVVPDGFDQIINFYGDIREYVLPDGTLDPRWEAEKLDYAPLPFSIPLSWDHTRSVTRLKVHKKIVPVFQEVFRSIMYHDGEQLIKDFGGTYAWRTQRGSSHRISLHAFGAAIDLNVFTNLLGTTGDMPTLLIQIFESNGFQWGGHFHRPDPMHFQYAKGY